ncbi:MAG: hypothetical protein V4724_20340 [Pseudomonadota bacterium]
MPKISLIEGQRDLFANPIPAGMQDAYCSDERDSQHRKKIKKWQKNLQ